MGFNDFFVIFNKKKIILTTGSVQDIARNIMLKKFKNYSLFSMPLWGMKAKGVAKNMIKKFCQN